MASIKFCVQLLIIVIVCAMGGWLYYYVHSKSVIELKANIINLYIKHRLSNIFPKSEISIQNTKLLWKKADENFMLLASNIVIDNSHLGVKISIPKFSLYSKIGILFLWGDFNFAYIDIPKVNINIDGVETSSNTVITNINSIKLLKKYFMKLVKLSIPTHVKDLTITNKTGESLLLDYLQIGIKKRYDSNVFSFTLGSNNSFMQLTLFEHYKGIISLNMTYNNFHTRLLRFLGFIDKRLLLYDSIDNILGNLNVVFDEYDNIKSADVNLQNINGSIPCVNTSICNVSNLSIQLNYNDDLLIVKDFSFFIDESNISVSGKLNTSKQDFGIDIKTHMVNTNVVCNYWPDMLYHKVKAWYCANVSNGNFSDVNATLNGNISDINDIILNYNISSYINNVSIMLDDHKFIKILKGKLLLDNENFAISSNSANFQGVDIVEGHVSMKMNDVNAVMYIKGQAIGNVRQLYKIAAGHSLLQFKENLIFGDVSTKFNFEIFNLANSKPVYHFKNINSKITSFAAKKIFDSFDINNATVNILLANNHLEVKTIGQMNNHEMNLSIIQDKEKAERFHYRFSGYLSSDNIKNFKVFGYNDFQGKAKANINWITNYSNANDILINGHLDVIDFNLGKKYFTINNQDGYVEFSALLQNRNDIKLTYANIIGKDIKIKLKGRVSKDVDLFIENVDVNAHIKSASNNLTVNLHGEFLDLSKVNFDTFFDKKPDKSNIHLNVRVKKILLKNNVMLQNATLSLNCNSRNCIGSKLNGYFSDNTVLNIEYSNIGLEIVSENAGSFLRAIDIMTTIEKGHLSFYMHLSNNAEETYGMFSLTNFYVVNASILAQILTLSSLKGILNTLNGQRIYFYHLNVPFTYKNHLIKIQESWMEGSELGISLSGDVNVKTKVFDVEGQIIPAYVINKIIWQTPVIGKLLTGGQSRGIIAIDYKVKGSDKEHDVSVNLMSILAPNLLKRVLKVFDNRMLQNTKMVG
ncbi:AsmA-like C-terminal domain-containing protein [Neoehrlichia mikurensis]|uniref:DUF3971 domain-containing protein n=1 Tax=Neoehrlichia mikurensis TaxID=89586 RepID=A0A9Q9F3U8_9RICK|nr:AsmA-like C-terminal domain-containing protein [Neoehrlichia mikurensis]QXK91692.1 AsmA-like C-terminal domain-containing protein [Neoehrlichia mikurensis]QXK92903.1 AsmA-like C-terminal domain-containing protein [Neoehrlichia mikurensis]QXK93383.1 AsmA-like C-terminal domain-containing protein [Neoehrlichia mikurensis]UTO55669.1 DUF3971 domain-containing protein [Neoehrlichia mikurensis]UTO56589.1 DUF3971 domain-containing protein [Neoehrlichia mikurensis]